MNRENALSGQAIEDRFRPVLADPVLPARRWWYGAGRSAIEALYRLLTSAYCDLQPVTEGGVQLHHHWNTSASGLEVRLP